MVRRVKELETRADKNDARHEQFSQSTEAKLADHERRIKALEAMDFGSGDVDTAAIMKQVNMVRSELSTFQSKTAQDLEGLRLELQAYTDRETGDVKKFLVKKIDEGLEQLRYELDRLRAEFETFKNKDFRDLEARVSALEKKFLKL